MPISRLIAVTTGSTAMLALAMMLVPVALPAGVATANSDTPKAVPDRPRAVPPAEAKPDEPKPAEPKPKAADDATLLHEGEYDVTMSLVPGKAGTAFEREYKTASGGRRYSMDMKLVLERFAGAAGKLESLTSVVQEDDKDGRFVRLSQITDTSGPIKQYKEVVAVREGDKLRVTVGDGTKEGKPRLIDWPKDVLSSKEAETKFREGGLKVGKKFAGSIFPTPENLETPTKVSYEVVGEEQFTFKDKTFRVWKVKNVVMMGSGALETEVVTNMLMDDEGRGYVMTVGLGGLTIEMRRVK